MLPIPIIIVGLIVLFLFAAIFTVKQQTAAVIETFGKFSNIRQSGFQLKIPGVQRTQNSWLL